LVTDGSSQQILTLLGPEESGTAREDPEESGQAKEDPKIVGSLSFGKKSTLSGKIFGIQKSEIFISSGFNLIKNFHGRNLRQCL
jgi:hypothetical protein